jgi:hypothetical protein
VFVLWVPMSTAFSRCSNMMMVSTVAFMMMMIMVMVTTMPRKLETMDDFVFLNVLFCSRGYLRDRQ